MATAIRVRLATMDDITKKDLAKFIKKFIDIIDDKQGPCYVRAILEHNKFQYETIEALGLDGYLDDPYEKYQE